MSTRGGEARARGARRAAVLIVVIAAIAVIVVVATSTTSGSRSDTRTSTGLAVRTRSRPVPPQTANTVATLGVTPVDGPGGGPSGIPLPRRDPPGWRRVFADDFPASEDTPLGQFTNCRWDGPGEASECLGLPAAARARWFAYPDGTADPFAHGTFESSQVLSINDGVLDFALHPDAAGHATIAALTPRTVGTWSAGVFAIRFRADRVPGYALSFQLWPASGNYRRDGGLQFPGGDLSGTINAILGQPGVPYGNPNLVFTSGRSYGGWHTAVIEWKSRLVRYFLDGRLIGSDRMNLPTAPMLWILQAGPQPDSPGTMAGHGHVSVAWVAGYAPVASAPGSAAAGSGAA